jgi:hypothetical protein
MPSQKILIPGRDRGVTSKDDPWPKLPLGCIQSRTVTDHPVKLQSKYYYTKSSHWSTSFVSLILCRSSSMLGTLMSLSPSRTPASSSSTHLANHWDENTDWSDPSFGWICHKICKTEQMISRERKKGIQYSSGQPKPATFIVAERLVEIVQFLRNHLQIWKRSWLRIFRYF